MTAQRRRDPRLPGWSIFEDVETVVGGETVRSVPVLSPVDEAIIATNDRELRRRSRMWGKKLDHWLPHIMDAVDAQEWDVAVPILRERCRVLATLTQYDSREPDWWAYWMLARAYRGLDDPVREEATIRAWLAHWPHTRERTNRDRETALKRLRTVQGRRRRGRTCRGPVVPEGPHT